MKRNILLMLFIILSLFLFACGEKDNGDDTLKSFSLDASSVELYVGDEYQINVTSSGLKDSVTWESSDKSVATVSNGKIIAIKEGNAVISATCETFTATVKVKVSLLTYTVKFYADGELIQKSTVNKGESAKAPADPQKVGAEFKCWDKDFTNVTSDLEVNAVFRKSYNVNYELNGGVLLSSNAYKRYDDEDFTLPKAGKVGCEFLGWTKTVTDDKNYISVIKASEVGDVTLYAQYKEKSTLNVSYDLDGGAMSEAFLANLGLSLGSIKITGFNTKPSSFWGGGYSSYAYVCEKSSDPSATFSDRIYIGVDSETGFYKILQLTSSGSASFPSGAKYVIAISTSYNDYQTTHAVFLKLSVGNFVIFDGDVTKAATKAVNIYFFEKSPEGEVKTTVSKTNKLPTPTKLGFDFLGWFDEYDNKASSGADVYDGMKLIAKWNEKNPVTELCVDEFDSDVIVGETLQVKAYVKPTDAYFKTVLYLTSDTDVLTIDSNGLITTKNAGTATITIVDYMNKFTYTKEINVYPVEQISIELEGYNDGVLSVGETLQLKAKAFGKDVNGITFTYKSDKEAVLTVSSTGLLTAVSEGEATITITDSAKNTHTLELKVVVNNLSASTKVDEVIKLIAENNFAVVETGNVCLYNDGNERYYDSIYGSVNKYLFQDFNVIETYRTMGRETMESTIRSNGTSDSHYRDPGEDDIEFVTVHDTATLTGTVESIASIYNGTSTSIHYTVGNGKIYGAIPEEYIAYHAGDGTGTPFKWINTGVKANGSEKPQFEIVKEGAKYYFQVNGTKTNIEVPDCGSTSPKLTNLGPTWKIIEDTIYMGCTWYSSTYGYVSSHGGNNNSIGIEMCVNTTSDIYLTWQQTSQLVADICLRNGLGLERVCQHNTFSGKNCPQCIIAGGYWENFMEMVKVNYEMMSKYSDVKVTMKSNNPEILKDNGRIIKAPQTTTTVSYTVTVSCGSATKTITLYSLVPGSSTWQQWDGRYSASAIWNDGKFSYTVK